MSLDKFGQSLKIAKQKPVSLVIYEQLLNAIINGKLKEGERIVELNLSQIYGVSRQPIRQALRMLEIDGFIESIPYKGVIVSHVTPQEAKEILELKGIVEGYAASQVAISSSPEVISELERNIEMMEEHIEKGNHKKIFLDNQQFHFTIAENAANDKMFKYYKGLFNSLKRFYAIGVSNQYGWKDSLNEHRQILLMIKNKDGRGAEECARKHAFKTIDRMLLALANRRKN